MMHLDKPYSKCAERIKDACGYSTVELVNENMLN
jgi:hypothetical protein